MFRSKQVRLDQPITTTCGSGVTAAALAFAFAFALELCGAGSVVRVYDGSWAEYAQTPGVAVEKDP